jgi:hypothetical protein
MKRAVSFRLSPEALQLLKQMALRRAINNTAMLEILIRDLARKEPKERKC